MEHKIIQVMPGSIAEEMEVVPGDVLLKVNDEEIEDIFDYRALVDDEFIVMLIRKENGDEWELEIEKDPEEDPGLVFESDLMSDYRSCQNQCVFCFIDQMPPGMRETLYFKDDDSRLSFLQGNYITGTNMKKKDIERIIRYRMEPINISVHATDPELRKKMLNNRFAGKILEYMDMLFEAGIHMNGQIVLCKGLNDKEALKKTLSDLYKYLPYLQSVSVVPVGLTKYREGLYPLEPLTKADAEETIEIVEAFQKKAFKEFDLHFVHASDELYLLAERDFPEEDRYDGYLQLENGVGMARLLFEESRERLEELKKTRDISVTMATGLLAEPLLNTVKEMVVSRFPEREDKIDIVGIRNDFFGPNVTVAGLVTGQDLMAQLKERAEKGKPIRDFLVLPNVMFRSGEEVFLDDVTREDAEKALGCKIIIAGSDGKTLTDLMCGLLHEDALLHGEYEGKN